MHDMGAAMSPSDQWLFETLDSMRKETGEQHQRLRADMNAGFDRLRVEIQALQREQSGTDKRVLVMETERGAEAKQLASRAGWVAFFAGAALTLGLKLLDWFWKR